MSDRNATLFPGLTWYDSGLSALHGGLLERFRQLDALFVRFAASLGATEIAFPPLISVQELQKIDYFASFPHLFTAAAALSPQEANLRAFKATASERSEGLKLTELAPVTEILTPAACYPLYVQLQGSLLTKTGVFTTRATCFRREKEYVPLRRQWAFNMREIICMGSEKEVKEFLDASRARITKLFSNLSLEVSWEQATDPFFDPATNPRYVMQRVDPVKFEMMRSGLSIGSVNFHRQYFGEAFEIGHDGSPAFSGCVAFGLERWLWALIDQFGPDVDPWPDLSEVRLER